MSEVVWTLPAPLWTTLGDPADATIRRTFRQPSILRFATDSFMDEFLSLLESEPLRLGDYVARRETWRDPVAPAAPIKSLPTFARKLARSGVAAARPLASVIPKNGSVSLIPSVAETLKLYHPAHQRFYLVAACLTCQTMGLPDRVVNASNEERVSFVMRRLLPPTAGQNIPVQDWDEYAFVNGAWQKLDQPDKTLATGEEELPLSAVTYQAEAERKRRVWIGTVPVGKREVYVGAPASAPVDSGSGSGTDAPLSPREALLRAQVIEPWKNLINDAYNLQQKIALSRVDALQQGQSSQNETEIVPTLVRAARNKYQELSWYILLDLANYLQSHFGDSFWTALATPNATQQPFAALQQTQITSTLETELENETEHPDVTVVTSLSEALLKVGAQAAKVESAVKAYEGYGVKPTGADEAAAWEAEMTAMWPDFIFPLVDLDQTNPNSTSPDPKRRQPNLRIPQPPGELNSSLTPVEALKELIEGLMQTILAALPTDTSAPLPPLPLVAQKPANVGGEDWFVIRCMFKRPNCGPLQPPLLSEPTQPFQLAPFFDPDAPARPIRISLPVDTTPAGLRKFNKNTAFVISDVLCGQIERAKGLGLADLVLSVLPWPFHKDLSLPDGGPCQDDTGFSVGMICSLSIPIVTICALILLMIIVGLLDYIFRWLPYFILCFPLPGFKAKK